MAKQSKLSAEQKQLIVKSYEAGNTQTALAELYGVGRRTIQRILIEAGLLPPTGMAEDLKRKGYKLFTEDQQKILAICKESDIDSERLTQLMQQPSLNAGNMIKTFALLNAEGKLKFLQEARALEEQLREIHAQAS